MVCIKISLFFAHDLHAIYDNRFKSMHLFWFQVFRMIILDILRGWHLCAPICKYGTYKPGSAVVCNIWLARNISGWRLAKLFLLFFPSLTIIAFFVFLDVIFMVYLALWLKKTVLGSSSNVYYVNQYPRSSHSVEGITFFYLLIITKLLLM